MSRANPRERIHVDTVYRKQLFTDAKEFFSRNPHEIKYDRQLKNTPLSFIKAPGPRIFCLVGHSLTGLTGGETKSVKRAINEQGNTVFVRRLQTKRLDRLEPTNPGIVAAKAYYGPTQINVCKSGIRGYLVMPDCGVDWQIWLTQQVQRIEQTGGGSCLLRLILTHEILYMFGQAMLKLSELHAKGFLHRDVKLENLTVANQANGQPPAIELIDFGYAIGIPASGTLHDQKACGVLAPWAVCHRPTQLQTKYLLADYSIQTDFYALARSVKDDLIQPLRQRLGRSTLIELNVIINDMLKTPASQTSTTQKRINDLNEEMRKVTQLIQAEAKNPGNRFYEMDDTKRYALLEKTSQIRSPGLPSAPIFNQLFSATIHHYKGQLEGARNQRAGIWAAVIIAVVITGILPLLGVIFAVIEKNKRLDTKLKALNDLSTDNPQESLRKISDLDRETSPRLFAGKKSRFRRLHEIAHQHVAACAA